MKKPTIYHCRRTLQISVAVAFIIIPWLNHMRISIVYGNFLSFHFFKFPLADPLAVLQITLKNDYLSADLLIGAGIAIALAVTLGTVFCSWICPFGLLSEWGQALSGRLNRKKIKHKLGHNDSGFWIKLIVFFAGLAGFFVFSTTPVLNQLSMPAWYSRIFQFWFEQWHISMGILAIILIIILEAMTARRLWCRYVCPQSVLIILAKQLNPRRMRVHFDLNACICKSEIDPCSRACSLNLIPKIQSKWPETECTNCGDCITVCNKLGAALTFTTNSIKNSSIID